MSRPIIQFENVHKEFSSYHEKTYSVKKVVADAMAFRFRKSRREKKTVLRNINLTISEGEFVGFMGRNGTGKSTLLKLISRIYTPTSGQITTHGRIAPLLELGAGFALDLDGYENILLNASILGFGRAQVMKKIDAIMQFADIGDAIDQPVRTYSSGMLVRLGFSIAALMDAEILLFDEILAVGDVGFQQKCLGKIRELHESGRTIVLVTHTPEQVQNFCSRCVVFDHEGIHFDGSAKNGADSYVGLFAPTPELSL